MDICVRRSLKIVTANFSKFVPVRSFVCRYSQRFNFARKKTHSKGVWMKWSGGDSWYVINNLCRKDAGAANGNERECVQVVDEHFN